MYNMDPSWGCKHIADLIKASRSTVVFTGAGMSTESGLPDFRSNGGLWDGKDPMKISHVNTLNNSPESIANFYAERIRDRNAHQPNRGHEILAEWEAKGIIHGIATQNIDGYHQAAGSKKVHELHGGFDLYCNNCGKEYPTTHYTDPEDSLYWECKEEDCEGTIRPRVTLFGELLPDEPFKASKQLFKKADLCIIMGSSCSVFPANSLPYHVIDKGGQIVILNKGETDLDYHASYKVSDWSITKALEKIDKLLRD